jgi:hypothetical protein
MARLAVSALALAVLLAGCGGGGARKPSPSKSAFITEVNRICAQARTRTGRLARLRALRPPVGEEDLFGQWLKAERDALEAIRPTRKEPEPPLFDPEVAQTVAEAKIAGYARRLGAETCARRATGRIPP